MKRFLYKQYWRLHRHIFGRQKYIDLSTVDEQPAIEGRIAVHLHMYYIDLAEDMIRYLNSIPYPFDLFVSVTNEENKKTCNEVLPRIRNVQNICVEVVPNRGRDISPMVCTFARRLLQYDYLCHLHTKKSISSTAYDKIYYWRDYVINSILKDEQQVYKIFYYLQRNECGVVFAEPYHALPYANLSLNWFARVPGYKQWASRYLKHPVAAGTLFPAGTMFWARVASLRNLLEAEIPITEFPVESGVLNDYSFAHVLERFMGYVPVDSGYKNYIIQSPVAKYFGTKSVREARGEIFHAAFNAEAYSILNPDVVAAGIDPLTHYNTCGFTENRYPNFSLPQDVLSRHIEARNAISTNAQLDTKFYLSSYITSAADFLFENIHPEKHFSEVGQPLGYLPNSRAYDAVRDKAVAKDLLFTIIVYLPAEAINLEKTLQSLQSQSVENIEVIILAHGLDDKDKKYIESLPAKYLEKAKIISCAAEQGKMNAFMKGIELAKGSYFTLLKSGDCLYDCYLENMGAIAEAYSAACVSCYKLHWIEGQVEPTPYEPLLDIRLLKNELKVNSLLHDASHPNLDATLWNKLINVSEWKKLLSGHSINPDSCYAESIAMFHFVNACSIVAAIRNKWVHTTVPAQSDCKCFSPHQLDDLYDTLALLSSLLKGTYEEKSFFERYVDQYLIRDFNAYLTSCEPSAAVEITNLFEKRFLHHKEWFTNKQFACISEKLHKRK